MPRRRRRCQRRHVLIPAVAKCISPIVSPTIIWFLFSLTRRLIVWGRILQNNHYTPYLGQLSKDYCIDGLRTLAAKIGTMSAEGGLTRDPNYTPGVDFLDHDFFIIFKNSHHDLYNEGSNFILSSVGH